MQIIHSIKSIRTGRTVEFIIDDSEPDIIRIKMGSSCLQLLASEVGLMFCDIDSFLAKSIERTVNMAGAKELLDRERPHGEWIIVKQDTILGTFEVKNKVCDKCNHATKYEYPFCPWCGADMRGEKNEKL